MTDFFFFSELERATEQWKLAHPQSSVSSWFCKSCRQPIWNHAWWCSQREPTYWDEKKKDRREEFKREQAEDHERVWGDKP